MIVKICGITNQGDATAAVKGGATAVGFNFYPKSPRYIAPERAAEIRVETGVRRVGVFVNETPEHVAEIARIAKLDVAQLHGSEGPEQYPDALPVWKAARATEGFDFARFAASPCEALLLDGPAGGLFGGAGKTFDWSIAKDSARPVILAGGLDASNVAQAVAAARPWGVDACSRIESEPGKKDIEKMLQFISAARKAFGV